eukprot:1297567-Amphidinium_carterae.1
MKPYDAYVRSSHDGNKKTQDFRERSNPLPVRTEGQGGHYGLESHLLVDHTIQTCPISTTPINTRQQKGVTVKPVELKRASAVQIVTFQQEGLKQRTKMLQATSAINIFFGTGQPPFSTLFFFARFLEFSRILGTKTGFGKGGVWVCPVLIFSTECTGVHFPTALSPQAFRTRGLESFRGRVGWSAKLELSMRFLQLRRKL